MPEDYLTCIHQPFGQPGLCDRCQPEYDEDPLAWIEFGDHVQGVRNRRALDEEMRKENEYQSRYRRPADEDDDIPF